MWNRAGFTSSTTSVNIHNIHKHIQHAHTHTQLVTPAHMYVTVRCCVGRMVVLCTQDCQGFMVRRVRGILL